MFSNMLIGIMEVKASFRYRAVDELEGIATVKEEGLKEEEEEARFLTRIFSRKGFINPTTAYRILCRSKYPLKTAWSLNRPCFHFKNLERALYFRIASTMRGAL
jgi:hypothetical protein